jgi:hypothetical protein
MLNTFTKEKYHPLIVINDNQPISYSANLSPSTNISLLFLTHSNIIHSNEYIIKGYSNTDVYIHPKEQHTHIPFSFGKIISNLIPTKWGDLSIVQATLLLLLEAYQNNGNQWFILCSGDSYPLLSFKELVFFLKNKHTSLFNRNSQFPFKTSQWWCLCRDDVFVLLTHSFTSNIQFLTKSSKQTKYAFNVKLQKQIETQAKQIAKTAIAIDEWYFLLLLSNKIPNYKYEHCVLTYVDFSSKWISKHPTIFNQLLPSNQIEIIQNKCFFIRKTLPSFQPMFQTEGSSKKKNAILIIVGTHNANNDIINDLFFRDLDVLYDIYLLSVLDGMNTDKMYLCKQIYSSVWRDVEKASKIILENLHLFYDNVEYMTEEESIIQSKNKQKDKSLTNTSVKHKSRKKSKTSKHKRHLNKKNVSLRRRHRRYN